MKWRKSEKWKAKAGKHAKLQRLAYIQNQGLGGHIEEENQLQGEFQLQLAAEDLNGSNVQNYTSYRKVITTPNSIICMQTRGGNRIGSLQCRI